MEATTLSTVDFLPLAIPATRLPNGEYHAKLSDALRDGQFLRSRFRILRGPFAGQFAYLITRFDDQKSRALFQSWCYAANRLTPHETSELAVLVLVTVKQRMVDGVSVPIITRFAKALVKDGEQ